MLEIDKCAKIITIAFIFTLLLAAPVPFEKTPPARAAAADAAGPDGGGQNLTAEQTRLNVESFDYIWNTIKDSFWDPDLMGLDWKEIGERYRPRVEKAESMARARGAMNEMLEELGQSHFAVIPREAYQDMGISGEGKGDRGETGIRARTREGKALVVSVRKGSPAERAGISQGWEITAAGGKELSESIGKIKEEFRDREFVEYIINAAVTAKLRGEPGDTLVLDFLDGEKKPRNREVILEERKGEAHKFGYLPPFYVWIDSERLDNGIGYIAFGCFFSPGRIMPEFNSAMASFQDAPGVILDLRGNPGGIAALAMGMAGWFVTEKGRYLGTLTTRETSLKLVINPRRGAFEGPAAVLVDEMSTSASEFLAGGLQAIGRARVFGVKTPGAALPSVIDKLANGDAFQYVIGNYVAEDGTRLEGRGVIPDQPVDLSREKLLKGKDPIVEAAVEWIMNHNTAHKNPTSPE